MSDQPLRDAIEESIRHAHIDVLGEQGIQDAVRLILHDIASDPVWRRGQALIKAVDGAVVSDDYHVNLGGTGESWCEFALTLLRRLRAVGK